MKAVVVFGLLVFLSSLVDWSSASGLSIAFSPDPNRTEMGSTLNITCSAAQSFSRNDFTWARLTGARENNILEANASAVVTLSPRSPGSVGFVVDSNSVTFIIYSVTQRESLWGRLRCRLVLELGVENVQTLESNLSSFEVVASVQTPAISWNDDDFVENRASPPQVTCVANVGYPMNFTSVTMVHQMSNGSVVDDVRLVAALSREVAELNGTWTVIRVFEIGCFPPPSFYCPPFSKANHGEWLSCTATNSVALQTTKASARRQMRVQHRMSTVRVTDANGRALAAQEVGGLEMLTFTPTQATSRLQFVCEADGEPKARTVWTARASNAARMQHSANASQLIVELVPRTGLDHFECQATQDYPPSPPIRRTVVLRLNVTAGAIEIFAARDHRLLIILLCAGGLALLITVIISLVFLRRSLRRSSRSRRARMTRKAEVVNNSRVPQVDNSKTDSSADGFDISLNAQLDDKPRSRKPIVEVDDSFGNAYSPDQSNVFIANSFSADMNGNTVPSTATIVAPGVNQFASRSPYLADSL